MLAHDLAHGRQSETDTEALRAVERLEDLLQDINRDAGTVVGEPDFQPFIADIRRDGQLMRLVAAALGLFQHRLATIVEDVDDDAAEAVLIEGDLQTLGRHLVVERDTLRHGLLVEHRRQPLVERDRFQRQIRGPREVEQLGDDVVAPGDAAIGPLQGALDTKALVLGAAGDQIDRRADRPQRVPELVRHRRGQLTKRGQTLVTQQVALGSVQLGGPFLDALFQFLVQFLNVGGRLVQGRGTFLDALLQSFVQARHALVQAIELIVRLGDLVGTLFDALFQIFVQLGGGRVRRGQFGGPFLDAFFQIGVNAQDLFLRHGQRLTGGPDRCQLPVPVIDVAVDDKAGQEHHEDDQTAARNTGVADRLAEEFSVIAGVDKDFDGAEKSAIEAHGDKHRSDETSGVPARSLAGEFHDDIVGMEFDIFFKLDIRLALPDDVEEERFGLAPAKIARPRRNHDDAVGVVEAVPIDAARFGDDVDDALILLGDRAIGEGRRRRAEPLTHENAEGQRLGFHRLLKHVLELGGRTKPAGQARDDGDCHQQTE